MGMGWDQVLGGRDRAGGGPWQHDCVKCTLDQGLTVLLLYVKKNDWPGGLISNRGERVTTERHSSR